MYVCLPNPQSDAVEKSVAVMASHVVRNQSIINHSISINQSIDRSTNLRLYSNAGDVLTHLGRTDSALEYYRQGACTCAYHHFLLE